MSPMGGGPVGGPVGPPEESGQNPNPVGGGFPSPAPAQANPGMDILLTEVRNIVSSARRLGMKFPSVLAEVRTINNAVAMIAQKVQQSGPAPETMAPPV